VENIYYSQNTHIIVLFWVPESTDVATVGGYHGRLFSKLMGK
jgi:hypothetical protein